MNALRRFPDREANEGLYSVIAMMALLLGLVLALVGVAMALHALLNGDSDAVTARLTVTVIVSVPPIVAGGALLAWARRDDEPRPGPRQGPRRKGGNGSWG